ncbi:hypothetical protein [Ruania albidiflava]|uniref:hypothetical protein n=1 Tax=Ruania albidiflava TaxID=366586 RepID=UPI0023F0E39C|nr:hypothetical protein [Ruania albidiflava]
MPSFAFESGYLVPATIGAPSTSPLTPQIRQALRDYLLDVIEADLFPVEWSEESDPVLTAMDRAGQVVTAVVTDRLDGAELMRALARAGEATATPWLTIAGRYRSGVAGFRRDWNAFRESRPPGATPGPQLYVVAGEIDREVLEATRVLHGVQVFAVDARQTTNGQQLLDVTAVQPATIRVLDGQVVHEIDPALTAPSASSPPAGGGHPTEPEPPAPVDTVPTPADAEPVAAPERARPEPASAVPTAPTPRSQETPETSPDPHLRAVAQLVGAPMPIELRHGGRVEHAVLTAEGALQLGGRTVSTIERATELLGGEPQQAWTSWHVAGFPMADARAEATGTTAPVRASRRRRHRNH